MRKKISDTSNSPPLEIIVPHDEAREKLSNRIDLGKELTSRAINSKEELENVRKEYFKWNDYNTELLKRLFTSEVLSNEYSYFGVGITSIPLYEPALGEKISKLHEDVGKKIHRLDSIKGRIELIPASVNFINNEKATSTISKSQIFIVHGQDNEAKLEVARFIEKVGFKPIILNEQASGSKTIIEKIEEYSDVGFGVVIYTPCDIGARNKEPITYQGRARQNVVFEHGFLIGKLGRQNVCTLVKGELETPNDISGIVYTSMTTSHWQLDLAKELRRAGYSIDMNNVI